MIDEIALLTIDPVNAGAFEAAVRSFAPVFRAAPGCRAMRLEREIEDPSRYRLVVCWNTVDDHMVGFRRSPAFQQWRNTAGAFFVTPPTVVHAQAIDQYF